MDKYSENPTTMDRVSRMKATDKIIQQVHNTLSKRRLGALLPFKSESLLEELSGFLVKHDVLKVGVDDV